MALKYALTCCTLCLIVSIGGRSSRQRMASMGVFHVVPRMTLVASFCTVSNLGGLNCERVVRLRP